MNEFEKRMDSLRSSTTRPTQYCEGESYRDGLTYEVDDVDFEWLMCELVDSKKKEILLKSIIERWENIVDGMVTDAEEIKDKINEIEELLEKGKKQDALMLTAYIRHTILGGVR